MALNFPPSDASPWTAPNGVVYTWNTDGYWEAKADPADLDGEYLKLDASNDPVTGNLALDQGLAVTGTSVFTGLTTHEAGVKVTGGTAVGVGTGFYSNGTNSLQLAINGVEQMRSFNGSSTQFRFGVGGSLDTTSSSIFNAQFLYNGTGHGNQSLTNIQSKVTSDTGITGSSNKVAAIAAAVDNQTGTGIDVIGVESAVETSNAPNGSAYNFYAAGSAPNYFAGLTEVENAFRVYPNGGAGSSLGDNTLNVGGLTLGSYLTVKRVSSGTTSVGALFIAKTTGGTNPADTVQRITTFTATNGTDTIDGHIQTDGSGGIELANTSDYRTKENIVDLPSAVDEIKALRPVNFNYIWAPGRTRPGFIAHELSDVLPVAATGTKDATEAIGTLADYDGTVIETEVTEPSAEELTYTEEVETEGVTTQAIRTRTWTATGTRPVYQGVDQTKLIPLLTKALQEALTEIDTLKTRLSDAGIA